MNKIAATIAICCALGSPAAAEMSPEEIDQFCSDAGGWAGEVMKYRQMNVPLSIVIQVTNETEDFSEAMKEWMRDLAVGTYDAPVYKTKEAKDQAVLWHRIRIENDCFKRMYR